MTKEKDPFAYNNLRREPLLPGNNFYTYTKYHHFILLSSNG